MREEKENGNAVNKKEIPSGGVTNLLSQLEKLRRHNRQGSFKTKERYYEAMKRFCYFAAEQFRLQKLANICEKHIKAYVADMQERGLSASTIKTDLAAIRFWHDLIPYARYDIPPNNTLELERRTFGKVDRAWTHDEFTRMIDLCRKLSRTDYAAIFMMARHVGLRIHECFRIDTAIAEQAVKSGEITIKGKGGKVRNVPINPIVKNELTSVLATTVRGCKLFVSDHMPTHLAIKQLQQFIIAHRKEVQDEDSDRTITFHGLRHIYAVESYLSLVDAGCSEDVARVKVSQLLGHERGEVTRIYLTSIIKKDPENHPNQMDKSPQ